MNHFDREPTVDESLIPAVRTLKFVFPGPSQADSVKPNCAEVKTAAGDISSALSALRLNGVLLLRKWLTVTQTTCIYLIVFLCIFSDIK